METFVVVAAIVAATFLVYGLLLAAGVVNERRCDCEECAGARRRDITRGW